MAAHRAVTKLGKCTCLLGPNKKLKPFNNTWLDTNWNGKVHLLHKCEEFTQKCDDMRVHKGCELKA